MFYSICLLSRLLNFFFFWIVFHFTPHKDLWEANPETVSTHDDRPYGPPVAYLPGTHRCRWSSDPYVSHSWHVFGQSRCHVSGSGLTSLISPHLTLRLGESSRRYILRCSHCLLNLSNPSRNECHFLKNFFLHSMCLPWGQNRLVSAPIGVATGRMDAGGLCLVMPGKPYAA